MQRTAKDVPVASPAPDLDEAARFLGLLDEGTEHFEFRTFDDSKAKRASLAGKFSGTFADHAAELSRLNSAGAGVFVVVNHGGQDTKSIDRIRSVFADTDGAPLDPITSCGSEPHIVVESSPRKYHAHWLVDGLALDEFKAMQQAIAVKFGTDSSVCDLPRVLRVPGFFHRKGTPFRVRIVSERGGLPYSAETLRAAFQTMVTKAPARPVAGIAAVESPTHAGRVVGVIAATQAEEIRSALASLDHDDRDTWWKCGAALHSTSAPNAFGLWTEWSKKSDKFSATDQKKTWNGFKAGGGIHLETIFAMAQGGGWQNLGRTGEESEPRMRWQDAEAAQLAALRREADENAPPQLSSVDLSDLANAREKPPRYVIDGFVPRRVVSILGAHGGVGKTTLALAVGAHVACEQSWAGISVSGGRVVFLSLEDEPDLIRFRLANAIDAYQLDADRVCKNMIVLDGATMDAALAHEVDAAGGHRLVETVAMKELDKWLEGAVLLIVDNASDGFDGNANDPRMVRHFIRRMLGKAARKHDLAVILLCHIDKAGARNGTAGNSYTGTAAWNNSARSRLALLESSGQLSLVHEKSNFSKKGESVALAFNESGVLMPVGTRCGDGDHAAYGHVVSDAESLLAAIRAASAAGVNVPTARTGPTTSQHVLATMNELPATLRGSKGRARFWAAFESLRTSGRVSSETFQNEHRHSRTRWIPV